MAGNTDRCKTSNNGNLEYLAFALIVNSVKLSFTLVVNSVKLSFTLVVNSVKLPFTLVVNTVNYKLSFSYTRCQLV